MPRNGSHSPPANPGRHDSGLQRLGQRLGRERGCWVYIAAEDLRTMGFADVWPIRYRMWAASERPRVVVNLYDES